MTVEEPPNLNLREIACAPRRDSGPKWRRVRNFPTTGDVDPLSKMINGVVREFTEFPPPPPTTNGDVIKDIDTVSSGTSNIPDVTQHESIYTALYFSTKSPSGIFGFAGHTPISPHESTTALRLLALYYMMRILQQ